MGKSKKRPKKRQEKKTPEAVAFHYLPKGSVFNSPMPDKTFICDLCGGTMYESHCKIICQFCGYIRDCSDP